MALNSPTQVNRTYNPKGATVPNGIRGGAFTLPSDPLSPGIEIGQVYTSYYRMNNASTIYTVAVPANSTVNVPMSTLQTAGNNFSIVYSQDGNYVQLSHPMRIAFSTTAGSILTEISGYDQYDQPMINATDPTSPITTNGQSTRCFNRLTAIQLKNTSGNAATVTISSTITLELPYFDYGKASLLLNVRNQQRPLLQATSNVAGSPIVWDFGYQPVDINGQSLNPITQVLTLYAGRPRSIITLNAFEADGGSGNIETIAVRQGVYGYNSLPNWFQDVSAIPSLINGGMILEGNGSDDVNVSNFYKNAFYSVAITGHPQYDVGWKAWNG